MSITRNKKGKYVKCANCGKEVYRYPRSLRKSKLFYCSQECLKKRIKKKCLFCGKTFSLPPWQAKRRKYCSFKCSCLDVKKIEKKRCLECNRLFEPSDTYEAKRRKFCSRECYWKSMDLDTGQRNYKALREWGEKVKKRDEYKCQWCGRNDCLIAHHLLPYALFVNERTKVSNGLTMCKDCHIELHRGLCH